jgi:hypothetical protein
VFLAVPSHYDDFLRLPGRMKPGLVKAAVAFTLALLTSGVLAASALGATAQHTIATLNVQRAANGIPAGLTEDAALSAACAKHDHYMALNHTLTHTEDPNNPGYSTDGADAGRNAVLTQGGNWGAGDPYEYAPLHLDQLLAPRLLALGSADAEGYSCTTTFPGWTRGDPPVMTVYTYPGNGAMIYPSEVARELPWTPGDLVGLAQPSRTGPTLFVFADAPNESPIDNPATLSNATVSGPSGPIEVRTVDGNTPLPAGSNPSTLAPYISPGGFIIPARPLIPGTTYHAHVVVTFDRLVKIYDWSFTTRAADPESSLTARGGRLLFSSRSRRTIRVTFSRTGGGTSGAVRIRPGHRVRLRLGPGIWRACGHQAAGEGFAAYDTCLTLTITGVPELELGKPHLAGANIRLSLHFSPVLRGRRATLTLTSLSVQCGASGCTTVSGSATTRRIHLRHKALLLPAPAHGQGFEVDLRTAAFLLRGSPWAPAHAMSVFIRR